MDEHIIVLRDAVEQLMAQVNAIDRIIPEMQTAYPNWDLEDTTNFRAEVVANLNKIIVRLNQI